MLIGGYIGLLFPESEPVESPDGVRVMRDVAHISLNPARSINDNKNFKERIIKLLENFAFNVDFTRIRFNFIQLPSIENITVFLKHDNSNHFYYIDHVHVLSDDDEEELE